MHIIHTHRGRGSSLVGSPHMEASPVPIPRHPQMLPHVTQNEDAKRDGTDAGVLLVSSDSSSTSDSAARDRFRFLTRLDASSAGREGTPPDSGSDNGSPVMLPSRRSDGVPKMRRKDSFSELRSRCTARSDSPKSDSDSTFTSSSRGLRAFWTEDGTKSMSFEDCEILEVMSDPTVAIACTFSPHHV